jgi:transcriptional regulator with XRE-family HTH domain
MIKHNPRMKPYHYTECGLDNVWLVNGVTRSRFGAHGEAAMVDDPEGLWASIAGIIVHQDSRIVGQELRFLRSLLDWTQTELGRRLGYKDGQMVARWEKMKHLPVPVIADTFVRVVYREKIGESAALTRISTRLQEIGDTVSDLKLLLEEGPMGDWKPRAGTREMKLA